MSKEFPELEVAKIEVDETTRSRHMTAISAAVREATAPRRRFRLLAFALAWVLLVPVMALASDRAVPGDFLYPLKQVFEPVVGVFDTDVAAEHRVEEVEILYERDAPTDVITRHIDVARDTVATVDSGDELAHFTDRLERVRRDLESREHDRKTDEEPVDDHTDRPAEGDTDRSHVTTTTQGDRPPRDDS